MNLTAIIADDEELAREELAYLLDKIGGVEVVGQASNGIEAFDLIRTRRPDLACMDVQMPGLDGFGVIKKLLASQRERPQQPLPQIVFATAYDRYAVRAFEVNAVDYLLKPFDRARVQRTIDKVRSRLNGEMAAMQSAKEERDAAPQLAAVLKMLEERPASTKEASKLGAGKVVVRAQNRLLLIDQKEICFAAIEDGSISVVTQSAEGSSNCRTLDDLMSQLSPKDFWRVHRSFVVNIHHIREVVPWFKSSYQLRMNDRKQSEIPVSRAQTKRLRELFNL
jgi:two-component system LytT family response regulator/two-component system response regulator LytT